MRPFVQYLNQHSLALSAALLLGLAVWILFRRGMQRNSLLALAAMLGVFLLIFFAVRTETSSAQQVDEQIGAGTPVLLIFQSEY